MTQRPLASLLLAAGLVIASGPEAVWAQTSALWRASVSGGFATLSYGPLDPEDRQVFLLSCLDGVNIAVLSVHMDFPESETGMPVTIDLSSGGKTAPVAGETAREEASGAIYVEAGDIAVKPILDVLRESGPVTVKVGDVAAELSERGRAETVAQFAKNCTLD